MTNRSRLEKIEYAKKILHEVEMSLDENDPLRRQMFKFRTDSFGPFGSLTWVIVALTKTIPK